MKKCYKCGAQLGDTDKFCTSCGAMQREAINSEPFVKGDLQHKMPNKKNLVKISVTAGVIVLLASAIGFLCSHILNGRNDDADIPADITTTEVNDDFTVDIAENNEVMKTEESSKEYEDESVEYEDEYVPEEGDEYYFGTYYEAPDWYEDDAVVVKDYEVCVGLGDAFWKNSKIPSSYWFIFENEYMSAFYCYYLSSAKKAREACVELSNNYNSEGLNALRHEKDEVQYWYLDNVLIMAIPGEEFEEMFQKDFYATTLTDVVEYFSKDYEVKLVLTEDAACDAVMNYCCEKNPDLIDMMENWDEYSFDWYSEEENENTYLVTYESYTGAIIYYHVDKYTGETTSTEFVPGITEEELEGEDNFNVWDYMY